MLNHHYEDILATQLAMNRETWAVLQQHGVTEESLVRLDFSYNAPRKDAAESLVALILEQTDYVARVDSSGSFLRLKWRVEGTTQPTTVSPEILDQWVTWMVAAGKERVCDFDGWGTPVGLTSRPTLHGIQRRWTTPLSINPMSPAWLRSERLKTI